MKKILSIILSMLFVMCFTGCSDEVEQDYLYIPQSQTKNEILNKAERGIMSPVQVLDANGNYISGEVSLFMLKSDLENRFTQEGLYTTEGDRYTCISAGDISFYFLADNIENGVISMIHFDSVYDFDHGISTPDNIIERLGQPVLRENVSGDELWFMPYSTGITCDRLSYKAGDNTLSFYFLDGFLSMTSLSVTKLW